MPLFSALAGSRSTDFSDEGSVENPLPPCPNSPNCIRITKQFNTTTDTLFDASVTVVHQMGAEKVRESKEDHTIKTVFKAFVFRDDLALKFSNRNRSSSFIHIRSASRMGETDLGVNRRRVQRLLNKLPEQLRRSS